MPDKYFVERGLSMVWGLIILGTVVVGFVGGFKIMGGFKVASFTKVVMSGVIGIAGGGAAGDAVATKALDMHRPPIVQNILEDMNIAEPCTWEDSIVDTWVLDAVLSAESVIEMDSRSDVRFRGNNTVDFSLYADFYNTNVMEFSADYGCGRDDLMWVDVSLRKREIAEILEEVVGSDVPQIPLSITFVFDTQVSGDSMRLRPVDAAFAGGISNVVKLFVDSSDYEYDENDGGCDLTDVACLNAALYYYLDNVIGVLQFERH